MNIKFINSFISGNLPLLIIIVAFLTYLSPIHLQVASWLPSLLLGLVIFFTGLSMNVEAIKEMNSKYGVLGLATLLKWTITVIISIALAHIFFSSRPEIAAGFILSGTVPNATAATLYTFIAGGNTSLVIAASFLDIIISPIITPLALLGVGGDSVTISFLNLLQSFILIVILPIIVGLVMQKKVPRLVAKSVSYTKLGSSITLLLIIHTIIGNAKNTISSELILIPMITAVAFLQVALPMILAYLILQMKWVPIAEGDIRAIIFHVGLCNTALAAILAIEFISEIAALPAIINMVINLSLGSYLANYLSRKKIQSEVLEM
ncbi:bile acid:sodium symporter family protein [Alkalihalobacillus sp. BA299]|uniref:bile acid:sodium symporter family protein n=1 Tax=Alkalihalobacillus sp. BA299 TaxID=2815938 RepID=UPI001ADB97A1|nr:bile acid:sodium symporter [Alkalihalobacillus sp. BA299]